MASLAGRPVLATEPLRTGEEPELSRRTRGLPLGELEAEALTRLREEVKVWNLPRSATAQGCKGGKRGEKRGQRRESSERKTQRKYGCGCGCPISALLSRFLWCLANSLLMAKAFIKNWFSRML